MYKLIVATGKNYEIGSDNKLLWHYKEDLKHFQEKTSGGFVVMGSTTHKSIVSMTKNPVGLPNRYNYVLSSKGYGLQDNGSIIIKDVDVLDELAECVDVWVIGGASVYEQYRDKVQEVYWTKVDKEYPEADTCFDISFVKNALQWKKVKYKELTDGVELVVYKKIV